MSIKNDISQPIIIDSRSYNFDGEIRVKINQFYKLDRAERLRILLLAEKTDEEIQKINTAIDGINSHNQTATQEINNLKTTVEGLPTKTGNNVFTGSNTFGNVNFSGGLSYSNNLLFSFKYLNLGAGNQSVFHLGNANFPINLLAKDNKILLNGKPFETGGEAETIFEGVIKINLNSGFFGDNGTIVEYSYAHLVTGKKYNLLFFEFEDDMERDFSFMREYNGDRYYLSGATVKNKTAIFRKGTNPVFYIKIDDEQKKIYIAYQNTNLSYICLKRMIGI